MMKKFPLLLSLGLALTLSGCKEAIREVKSLSLSGYTDTVFVGDPYVYDGKVTARFSDNTSSVVTSACTFSTIDTSEAGKKDLNVSYTYDSKTVTKKTVIDVITVERLEISNYSTEWPKNLPYEFDGCILAHFTNGSMEDVTDQAIFSEISVASVGEQTLNVSYTTHGIELNESANISIVNSSIAAKLTSISIEPTTQTVNIGGTYTFGGTITAKYSDGSSKTITSGYEVESSSVNTSEVGTYKATISYKEGEIIKSVEQTVVVVEAPKANLSSITVVGYSSTWDVGAAYEFDGEVIAHYEDGTTDNVTSKANIGTIDTSTLGTKTLSISYTEDQITKSTTVSIEVKENIETITPEQALAIIEDLGANIVSEKEYYVNGIVDSSVEEDGNGFNGIFLGTNLKFRSVRGGDIVTSIDDIAGKKVVIKGYLELYNGIYQIPYLPASASPTGEKYNAVFVSVESGGGTETVDVTNLSISPVNKTIEVGDISTLSPVVLPANATNKKLTWSSSNSSICDVDQTGTITGISKGSAVITATSHNGITATSNITVEETGGIVDGDQYAIKFNHFESDGQTELNYSTIREQIIEGSSYISSYGEISKVYKGMNGLKFGSSRTGGSLTINFVNSIANLDCRQIIVGVAQYGSKSTTVNVFANGKNVVSGSSGSEEVVATLDPEINVSELTITTTSRAYISGVTLVCGELTPIPVTGISIPETMEMSVNGTNQLSVTYIPSNANTGKEVTWSSNDNTIATVDDEGMVTGKASGNTVITATCGDFTATCRVSVKTISVTSVTVNPSSLNLTLGQAKQLTANVTPSNATNKNVTWSSSNSSVASVDSNGLVTAKTVGDATITVKTADGNKMSTCSVNVKEVTKDAWTIMIYMCGADLESEAGLASGDIKEILSINNQPEDINILIETGGAKSWNLSSSYISGATRIDSSKLSRWHVENKKIVLDETLTYASMGASSTLQSYLEWGIKEYPAEKTGVIFWNHGGAMYGCCYDEKKYDDSLTNSEMKQAFSKALANTGSDKLEFVGYDTCLTQVQDIAEFNSNYFNYMIASEEAEAGDGWDYDTWVDDLYSRKPTETILKAIVDGFISDNGGVYSTRSDQTLSYLDLNKMGAYKEAFESFAFALKSRLSNKGISKSTFASWMDKNVKAFCVDSERDEAYYCLFDVKDMLVNLSSNSTYNPGSSYINAVQTAFSDMVKYSVAQAGAGEAYGLGCIYCQANIYSSYIKSAYTSSETNFSNWLSFVKTYSYLA